jgi:hypothetical protein
LVEFWLIKNVKKQLILGLLIFDIAISGYLYPAKKAAA